MPKVSVIVPVYNVEAYLDECMESIINQTFLDIEVILVDDGSSDRSPELCDAWAKRDERVLVYHRKNAGVSAARNVGMEAASGEWVMFVDSDDWLELDAIELLYKKAKETDCEIIVGSYVENSPGCEHRTVSEDILSYEFDLKQYRTEFEGACIIPANKDMSIFPEKMRCGLTLTMSCMKLYKKQVIVGNDILFPEGIATGEDQIFNLRVIQAVHHIYFINYPIYHYRVRSSSVTKQSYEAMRERLQKYEIAMEQELVLLGATQRLAPYLEIRKYMNLHGGISKLGNTIQNRKEFFATLKILRAWMCEPRHQGVVADMKFSYLSSGKPMIFLLLLKLHLYGVLLGMLILKYRLSPEKLEMYP